MYKPELLLPAGNLEKLRFALIYGADSVYVGGKELSLRKQASNFTDEDLIEGVKFAHHLQKKVYVTVNVIPRMEDMKEVKTYLKFLEKIEVDGLIVSSPAIIYLAHKYTKLHLSLSTQASVSNVKSALFYKEKGIDRVVLARELTLDEIKYFKENSPLELEIFIHGGMCSAWSGRCTLSNFLASRDANSGGCAHSCRWNYDIFDNGKKINHHYFRIGSKDLSGLSFISSLMNIGEFTFKVEGRMKSVSYISMVAYTYRHLIDDIMRGKEKELSYYTHLLGEQINRETSSGFFKGIPGSEGTIYQDNLNESSQGFLGIVKSYDDNKKEASIEVHNYFREDEIVEIISPNQEIRELKVTNLNHRGRPIEAASHALEIVQITSEISLNNNDILRRKIL